MRLQPVSRTGRQAADNGLFQQTAVRGLVSAMLLLSVPGTLSAQTSREAIQKTLPKIVKIYGAGGIARLKAYGTGCLVSPTGHIATVWSHVLDSDEITVVMDNGRRYQAKVLGAEPTLDLAVLKITADVQNLPYFDMDQVVTVGAGTRVIGFSNMFKVAAGDEPVSILHGVIAARTKLPTRRGAFETPYDGPVYVVDAITNNSGGEGGALTTRDGKLIGMIGKELRNAQSNTWVNYAIPFKSLTGTIKEIISGKFVRSDQKPKQKENPGRYSPVDFGLVMVPDVIYRTPAYIDTVLPGSLASKAGLKPDDLVLFVNDELIQSTRMLKSKLGYLESGDTLSLIVRRGDTLVSVEISVSAKPEARR